MESGKPPIGNAQPVGGREKKQGKEKTEDLFRSYPRGRYRPSIFRPRAYRALILLAARTSLLCKTNRSHSLELYCIVFYLRRATDTIEKRLIPLFSLDESSKPDAPFYCECHPENLEIFSASYFDTVRFFNKVYCQKSHIHVY